MRFLDYVEINPSISLDKDIEYDFVEMANVSTSNRLPDLIEKKKFSSGVKFEKNDTVIARIEPCLQNGKKFFCKDIQQGFGSTEYLVFRPRNGQLDAKYLYYLMQTHYIRQSMISSMSGSTGRRRVNNRVFESLDINFPKLEIQKKIADILSHYDDLIENNQKQIALLEEAARRLYNEWFVKLHFPGYKNVKIVDGIPKGWKEGKLQDIGIFIRGKTITQSDLKEGNIPVVAGGLEPAYYHNKANTKSPVITISASGANAGYTKLYNTAVWSSDSSFLDEDNTDFLYWIYCYLKTNTQILSNLQKGSAQPHVYAKDINDITLMIPNRNLIILFNTKSKIIFNKIGVLSKQIEYLKEARDRLLPRLMNGEIEVK